MIIGIDQIEKIKKIIKHQEEEFVIYYFEKIIPKTWNGSWVDIKNTFHYMEKEKVIPFTITTRTANSWVLKDEIFVPVYTYLNDIEFVMHNKLLSEYFFSLQEAQSYANFLSKKYNNNIMDFFYKKKDV